MAKCKLKYRTTFFYGFFFYSVKNIEQIMLDDVEQWDVLNNSEELRVSHMK